MIEPARQDPHEVLEVEPGCSAEQLRAAYERAKRQLGPDSLATYALVDPAEARAMLDRIENAYRTLAAGASGGGSVPAATPEANVTDDRKDTEGASTAAPAETKPEARSDAAEPVAAAENAPAEAKAAPAPELAEPTKPVRKSEAELAPDGPVTGEALRRVREAHGLSLKDLEGKTKIGHWHLENIEKEKYADLPALVYLRGFLQSLARELKLDPIRVSRSYLEQMTKAQEESKAQPKKQG